MKSLLEYHDLILCIVSALEARDPYTSQHSSRVAEMTEALCEYMKVDEERTEVYHIAAHLHDIGKIGIKDCILLKDGRLKDEEWEIMKSHAEKGYQILINADLFSEVAEIVRSHHERYDGKGYPDGLCGQSIHPGARIIAVADSIDAMMSDRPYRKGMDKVCCREEIQRNTGIMFDPDVVRAALEHWDDLIARREDDTHQCLRQSNLH